MFRDLVYRLFSPLVLKLLEAKFAITVLVPEEVRALNPPYFLMSNHQGFWDPVMINLYLEGDVRFITTDAMFRSPFSKHLMQFLGAVPKRKARTDMNTMKQIMQLKKHGKVIGIFPEGQKTWDGVSLPLLFSSAKLVRKLAIPVVTVQIRGGYLSHPRWSVGSRKGRIELEYHVLYTHKEAGALSSEEIYQDLTKALYHDAVEWQKSVHQPFTGSRLAERVEQLLFLCPVCERIGTIHSDGDAFSCSHCKSSWRFEEYGLIEALDKGRVNPAYESSAAAVETETPESSADLKVLEEFESSKESCSFSSLRDWNRWQRMRLKDRLDAAFVLPSPAQNHAGSHTIAMSQLTILKDSGLFLSLGEKSGPIRSYPSRVTISLSPGWIFTICSEDSSLEAGKKVHEILKVPVSALQGLNIQNREILELSHEGILYSIRDKERRFSAYKWMVALELLQER